LTKPSKPAQPEGSRPVSVGALEPRSKEEQRVWEVLEQARQNVKPLAKREMEVETVSSEILNFRLR